MELRHLRYFVAAAEELHFSRAAERLFVTRPAVSRMISDLEEELGTELFKRGANGIALTAAGAVLLDRLRGLFKELTLTLDVTRRVGAGRSGILKLGYGSSTLHHPLFRASIKRLHDELPDVALSFFEGTRLEQLNALRNGSVDASFTQIPLAGPAPERRARASRVPAADYSDFVRLPVETSHLAVALPKGHRLAAHKTLKLADLAGEAFISVPLSSGSPTFGTLAALCEEAGFAPIVVQEVKNTATQLNVVAAGIGIGLLLTMPSSRYAGDVRVVPLRDVPLSSRLELLCLKSRASEAVIGHFTEIVGRLAEQADWPVD